MIFGSCNLKIVGLYPRLDENGFGFGDYCFSLGIRKEFAKKSYQREISETLENDLQKMGIAMIKKVFRYDETELMVEKPYKFLRNKEGKLTCLFSNLTVPGNACGLDSNFWDIEKELEQIDELRNCIEYDTHNIDNIAQCYAFLSLATAWENTIETILDK